MKADVVLRCFRIVAAVTLLACGRCAPSIHDTHVPRRTTPLSRDNARLSFEVARPPFLIFYFGFEEIAEKFRRGVDREGSKHSTAATLERVDSEAAVLPQDFEDTVHARQLKALCRRVGRRMSRQGPGRSPSMGLTHLNAARPREKSSGVPHCGSSKILSDLVSRRRATRLEVNTRRT